MKLISINEYPVRDFLEQLLQDKSTGKHIMFATNDYRDIDVNIAERTYITKELIDRIGENLIQPRVKKSVELQNKRTRKSAEVFTPSWVCNKMNNHCDEEWFGKKDVFNKEKEQGWITNTNKIEFPKDKTWKDYTVSNRLEITCGEAPYIVSRYDSSTGEKIPISNRIGILDRKLRIINENVKSYDEWIRWTIKAYQSVYGYEFQGDNLLIARINLLDTFTEYLFDRWNKKAKKEEIEQIVEIISWNFWQMDGITGLVPFEEPREEFEQMTFFDYIEGKNNLNENKGVKCKIFDWKNNKEITYLSMKEGNN